MMMTTPRTLKKQSSFSCPSMQTPKARKQSRMTMSLTLAIVGSLILVVASQALGEQQRYNGNIEGNPSVPSTQFNVS